jgi:hypothetical protein
MTGTEGDDRDKNKEAALGLSGENASAKEEVKAPEVQSEKGKDSRGFIFDLLDEISNATFVHIRLIKRYQQEYGRKLVIYIAFFPHPGGIITNEDSETIENVLRSCDMSGFEGLDLMLHSPGGLPQAAGDIIRVCRTYAPSFRVIVPNMAMSAATVLAMGSDKIVMSDTSKLGPIDPQMVYQTKEGTFVRAANSFIQAFGSLVNEANQLAGANRPIAAHLHLLTKQDPSWIIECVRARNATTDLAFRVLKDSMLKGKSDDEVRGVVKSFLDIGDQSSHGRTINPNEAKQMGLDIEQVDRNSEYWKLAWELYVRCERYTRDKQLAKYLCADTGGIEFRVQVLALGGA